MNELVFPCLSYSVLMTFTPGPNNVSFSTLGLSVGYRKSLHAAISFWIKWVGVAYMAWLAIAPFLAKKDGRVAASKAASREGLRRIFRDRQRRENGRFRALPRGDPDLLGAVDRVALRRLNVESWN